MTSLLKLILSNSRLPRVAALKIHLANLGQTFSRARVISAVLIGTRVIRVTRIAESKSAPKLARQYKHLCGGSVSGGGC